MLGFGSTKQDDVPSWSSRPLPIRGLIATKSGDGLVVPLLPPTTRGKNLSQKTLRRLLTGMLLTVFVGYCIVMYILIRQQQQQQQHQSIMDSINWGPTGHSMATSEDILRDHVHNMAKERRKELSEEAALQQQMSPKKKDRGDKAIKVIKETLGHQRGVTSEQAKENGVNPNGGVAGRLEEGVALSRKNGGTVEE
jgi:hypothetical protein